MLLQGAAYAFVWLGHHDWTHALETWRGLTSFALGVLSLILSWSAIPALVERFGPEFAAYQARVAAYIPFLR